MRLHDELELQLNAREREERLDAVRQLRVMLDTGSIRRPERGSDTNNHVHTTYSFSSYSPAAAVWKAYSSGLDVVGIVDHDSVGGASEFIAAGDILGITTTVGAELRVSFTGTPLEGRTLNNPDESNVAYIACHGIPHTQLSRLDEHLTRVRRRRNERNRAQVGRLNSLLAGSGLEVDFDADVVPLSMAHEGGSITERHILFALARKIEQRCGRGASLISFLEDLTGTPVRGRARALLSDTGNELYAYDILNVLKSELVSRFYVPRGSDCMPVGEVVPELRGMGIIPTYCYLGDVGESPTGDKRSMRFEDAYLDELFPVLRELGFEAIAYMPSRNTDEQLRRIIDYCRRYGFMEISGEDINQPRQDFICPRLREPQYSHLATSTWALVGHEHASGYDSLDGVYSAGTAGHQRDLSRWIASFAELGRRFRR